MGNTESRQPPPRRKGHHDWIIVDAGLFYGLQVMSFVSPRLALTPQPLSGPDGRGGFSRQQRRCVSGHPDSLSAEVSAATAAMKRAASRTSSKTPNVSSCIEQSPGPVDRARKVHVSRRAGHDQANGTAEESRQRFLEGKVPSNPGAKVVVFGILDQKIDVAGFRVKIGRADRAEHFEAQYAELAPQLADRLQALGNDGLFETYLLVAHEHTVCSDPSCG